MDIDLGFFDDNDIETTKMPTARILKKQLKTKYLNMLKEEQLQDVLKELPEKGYIYHIISNGKFDFFTFIPVLINYLNYTDEFYGSTWVMNRDNCLEIFNLYDKRLIKSINILTGLYFKSRETSIYATLLEGLKERKQRFICLENHAKVTLLCNYATENYIVIEGSANFTSNPRVEQYVISNDKETYDFHKNWMDEILN